MKASKPLIRTLASLGLPLALVACSSLTIDVDVYKGSLANHQDVQMQQLAAMAVGAKPLLEQLEDGDDYEGELRTGFDATLQEVLSLYEDLGDSLLLERYASVESLAKEYTAAANILYANNEELVSEYRHLEEALKEIRNDSASGTCKNTLAQGYLSLLFPEDTGTRSRRNWEQLYNSQNNSNTACVARLSLPFPDRDGSKEIDGANYAFEFIVRNDKLVSEHAKLLFTGWTSDRRRVELAEYTKLVANSFLESRRLFYDLFLAGLALLEAIELSSSSDYIAKRQVIESIAELIPEAVSRNNLAVSLLNSDRIPELASFASLVAVGTDSALVTAASPLPSVKNFHGALKEDLITHTLETITFLRLADQAYQALGDEEASTNGVVTGSETRIRRKYGLTPGPIDSEEGVVESYNDVQRSLEGITGGQFSLFAGSLQRGRLSKGLYAVIEDYINALEYSPTSVEQRRETLMNVLVRFSQKLLFMANYANLIESDLDMNQKQYIDVLQAVGNSILVQTDELRQREAYQGRQQAASASEVNALEVAYAVRPDDVVTDVVNFLRANFKADSAYEELINEKNRQLAAVQQSLVASKEKQSELAGNIGELENRVASYHSRRFLLSLFRFSREVGDAGFSCSKNDSAYIPNEEITLEEFQLLQEALVAACEIPIEIHADTDAGIFKVLADKLKPDEKYNDLRLTLGNLSGAKIVETTAAIADAAEKKSRLDDLVRILNDWAIEENGAPGALAALKSEQQANAQDLEQQQANESRLQMEREQVARDRTVAAKRLLAVAAVQAVRTNVINRASTEAPRLQAGSLTYDGVLQILRSELQGQTDALGFLAGLRAPRSPLRSAYSENPTQKEVLDDVIAMLRQQYIQSVQTLGEDNPASRNIAAALNVAAEQRSDMVYIRQAASYLRSSYPTAASQNGRGNAWRNLLQGQAWRSVPLVNTILEQESKASASNQIDSQFWQNINTVRVSGSGNTSYAIVKDDIGNWYVKGYSSDPKNIINSARTLAMFGQGSALDADFLGTDGEGNNTQNPVSWRTGALQVQTQEFNEAAQSQFSDVNEYRTQELSEFAAELRGGFPATFQTDASLSFIDSSASVLHDSEAESPSGNEAVEETLRHFQGIELYQRALLQGLLQLRAAQNQTILDKQQAHAQAQARVRSTEAELAQIESSLVALNSRQSTLARLTQTSGDGAAVEIDQGLIDMKAAADAEVNSATSRMSVISSTLDDLRAEEVRLSGELDAIRTTAGAVLSASVQAESKVRTGITERLKGFIAEQDKLLTAYRSALEVLSTSVEPVANSGE